MTITILVPSGAEYQAVCRGLKKLEKRDPPPSIKIIPIPIGIKALTNFLASWQQIDIEQTKAIMVMGLCGSLSPRYQVGDIVVYHSVCTSDNPPIECQLSKQLYEKLQAKANIVRGFTSDRLIYSAEEKRQLGKIYQADVVDMEGIIPLTFFQEKSIPVGIIRVVSDACDQNLPNLESSISEDGSLKTIPLAIAMLSNPFAAMNLIKGSLQGLKVLAEVVDNLF